MRIFHHRPLAFAACLFAVCCALLWDFNPTFKLLLASAALLGLLLLAGISLIRRHVKRTVLVSMLCLGAILLSTASSYLFFDLHYQAYRNKDGQISCVEGTVLERIHSKPYLTLLRVRLDCYDGKTCHVGATVECEYASALQVGDRFRLTGTSRAFTQDELFDEELYRLSDGCLTVITCTSEEDCEILPAQKSDPLVFFSNRNTRLSYQIRQSVGGEAGGVVAALLLGNRSWLTSDTQLAFRRAGVSHLLALSGLHVSILIGFLELLLKKMLVPKRLRAVAVPFFAVAYVAMTGFSVSTWRAALMLCILYLGFLLRQPYDSFTALCVVLALILTVTPYAVLDLSLWMSFLAAGGIIVFSPAVQKLLDKWQYSKQPPRILFEAVKLLGSALAIGIMANLALLLLSAWAFGEVSLASVPATLLLSLPVTLLIVCGAILLCFPMLPILPSLCGLLGELILKATRLFSDLHQVLLPVGDPWTLSVIALLTLVLILLAVLRIKRLRALILLPLLCVATVVSSLCVTYLPHDAVWKAQRLEAGFGEVRLYTRHGQAILINDTRGASSAAYEIQAAASAARCTEIESLVLSRYYNQATYFISRLSSRIRVRTLHLPIPADARERAIAERLSEEAGLYGIEVVYNAEEMLSRYDTM